MSFLRPNAAGSELKLAHAQDRLDEIAKLIQGWLDACLETLREEPDPDEPGYFLAWIDAAEIDSHTLSLLIGECLQAFRSTLDHLAFELASVCPVPMTDEIEKRSAFPVLGGVSKFGKRVNPASQWASSLGNELRGITNPLIQAEIERLQPYHRGDAYSEDTLWVLTELNNVDKHRVLHVARRAMEGASFPKNGPALPRDQWSTNVRAIGLDPPREATIKIGGEIAADGPTQVARWPMLPIDPSKPMHMNFRPVLDVLFAAGTPLVAEESVLDVLREINDHIVSRVLPPLVPFLK